MLLYCFLQNVLFAYLDVFFFGCYRINKLYNSHSLSEKFQEIPLEQEDSVVTKCTKINFNPEKKAAGISEHRVSEFKEKVLEPRTTGCYKPPIIPNMKEFEAIVSCVGDDGTVFVVPKLAGKIFHSI